MSLEKTGQELERTAIQVAGIAVELNAVAKDLGGDKEALRLRALGLQAEAGRLALAALSAARAGEQIACAAQQRGKHGAHAHGCNRQGCNCEGAEIDGIPLKAGDTPR